MAGMAPMLATPGPPPSGSGWSWEMKFDGQRCIARVASGEVSLLSRNLSMITSTYPEITAALVNASGGRDVVVDGEIVARGAVYGPRGIAHTSTDPVTDFEVLTKIGSDANAVENSAVFRADTAEGARTYLDSFLGSNRTRGWTGADNPPGLPIASCQKHPTSQAHSCALTVGRYGAQVIGNTKTDAHQQASAQYLILTTADQRAH